MEAIGSFLALLHAWVATAGALLAALLVLLGALHGMGAMRSRRWLDRGILALAAAMGVAILLGPGIVIAVRAPSDPMHFLYAAVALLAVPIGRLAAMRGNPARTGWWVAAGGLVTLGVLLRLWQTGG